jgi:hypothetical protein
VTISDLTVTNGQSSDRGGTIFFESRGAFTLRNVMVMHSAVTGVGGGLKFRSSSALTIEGATFTGNSA